MYPVMSYGDFAWKYRDAARISHETKILRALHSHHGVVPLQEFNVSSDDDSFLVMPLAYCDAFHLVQKYALSRHTKNAFANFIIPTVSQLHGMGLFHGDIRLEHILVYGDDNFKLCDFQKAGSKPLMDLTTSAHLDPSPYYAPEAYTGYVNMFEQDVWATGMTIYLFWCDLHPPFVAANTVVDFLLTHSHNKKNNENRVPYAHNFFENRKAFIIYNFCKFCKCEGLLRSMIVSNMLSLREERCTFA